MLFSLSDDEFKVELLEQQALSAQSLKFPAFLPRHAIPLLSPTLSRGRAAICTFELRFEHPLSFDSPPHFVFGLCPADKTRVVSSLVGASTGDEGRGPSAGLFPSLSSSSMVHLPAAWYYDLASLAEGHLGLSSQRHRWPQIFSDCTLIPNRLLCMVEVYPDPSGPR